MRKIVNLFFRGRYVVYEVLRGVLFRYLIIICGGKCGSGLRVGRGVKFKYAPHENIELGRDVYIGDFCIIDVTPSAEFKMGNNAYLSVGVFVASNISVRIGAYSLIAEYSSIRDHDHGFALGQPVFLQENQVKPVVIEDDVWVGRGVAVLKGSHIQSKSIIGANSVVKGDVQCGSIVAGAPAKFIKNRC